MAKRGSVRIIAGQWRRRRIAVPEDDSVRPTPDRVRETLFNWLANSLDGARCLDLFAGTGALGLEAASRGAAEVVLVEREAALVERLSEAIAALGANGVTVRHVDALAYLQAPAPTPFDVVFVDPPFGTGLASAACAALAAVGPTNRWLAPEAEVYVETAVGAPIIWPSNWRVLREKEAGKVRYYLATPAQN